MGRDEDGLVMGGHSRSKVDMKKKEEESERKFGRLIYPGSIT